MGQRPRDVNTGHAGFDPALRCDERWATSKGALQRARITGPGRCLSQPTRMILRHIERRPWKSALTTVGLALASSIMTLGGFQPSAIDLDVSKLLEHLPLEHI